MQRTAFSSCASTVVLIALILPLQQLSGQESIGSAKILKATNDTDGSEESITMLWSQLAPKNGKPFNDPFAKLNESQIADLCHVARVQSLVAEEKIEAEGPDAREAAELAHKLTNEGIDIDWLMAQRQHVQQLRARRVDSVSRSIVRSLGDRLIRLTGYVIPIKVSHEKLIEFLVVPTTAACSHEAAPPRLKVVLVTNAKNQMPVAKGTPVRVVGKLSANANTRMTTNGNGRLPVHAAYELSSPMIDVLRSEKR